MNARRLPSIFAAAVLAAVFLSFAYLFRVILVPFIIAYILQFALRPFVNMLTMRGMKFTTAVLIVFSGTFLIAAVALAFIIPAISDELVTAQENIETYTGMLTQKYQELEDTLNRRQSIVETFLADRQILSEALNVLRRFFSSFITGLTNNIFSLLTLILNISIIPFATFFFLYDGQPIYKKIISMVPNRYFEVTLNLLHSLNNQVILILRGMLIQIIIISFAASAGLWLIGLDFPILIGVFAGVSNLIPYFGPIAGTIAACGVALMTGKPLVFFLSVVIVFLVTNLIDNILVQPIVFSKAANLHPLAVIFLVLIGSRLGGMLGMLLAVPLASLLRVVIVIISQEIRRPVRTDFSKYTDRGELAPGT
ncbi:AI-2E family transporter [Candidatus Latescibacterota bacterium]